MKLYVGNLPYSVTEEDLKELFSEYDSFESAQLIIDRTTNRSKGFAFVELSSDQDGHDAIKKFHESEYQGRAMIVNEARPQEKRENRGDRGDRGDRGERRPFNRNNNNRRG